MKKIAIITARSGSKGLPNKNVLLADGKPLIAYSIEAAINSGEFEKIIVSTDSQEYIDLLSHYPIDFIKRAEHLASDKASSFVVIEDVLNQYQQLEFDYFMLLQPTSPLRTASHIQAACEKFEQQFAEFDYLVSVCQSAKSTTLIKMIEEDESLKHFQLDYSNYARQQCYAEYSPNGAIFAAKPQAYLTQKHFFGEKSLAFFMDDESSIDIDDRQDFEYFYFILQQRKKEQILLNEIKRTILIKKDNFKQVKPITLIGHSILDFWDIDKLNGQGINNLGIAGISTQEYKMLILDQNLLCNLGKKAVLMLGTNDLIRQGYSKEKTLLALQEIVKNLREINVQTQCYFIEITPVGFRADRNNQEINELNQYLQTNLKDIKWIALNNALSDKYGKLDLAYSHDGLHLNAKGYEKLTAILEKEMK